MDKLRVSTITGLSQINTNINLQKLFDNIEINDTIKYVQWGLDNNKGINHKEHKKKKRDSKKKKKKNVFYNQVTLHYYLNKIVNVKIFNNGKIHMSGLKKLEYDTEISEGRLITDGLIQLLTKLNDKETIVDNINMKMINYSIINIVSDFMIDYVIDRNILHRNIINMNMFSSYEPLIYPGVNIKYFYNTDYNDGICKCTCKCNGKGNGSGNGNCKRITIAAFMSGSIIITGARNVNQLLEAYNFINNLMTKDKKQMVLKFKPGDIHQDKYQKLRKDTNDNYSEKFIKSE